jgi:hypothetical protein
MKILAFDEVLASAVGNKYPVTDDSLYPAAIVIDIVAIELDLDIQQKIFYQKFHSRLYMSTEGSIRWYSASEYSTRQERLIKRQSDKGLRRADVAIFILTSDQECAQAVQMAERYHLKAIGFPVLLLEMYEPKIPTRILPSYVKRVYFDRAWQGSYVTFVDTLALSFFYEGLVCMDYADVRSVFTFCGDIEYVRFECNSYDELTLRLSDYVTERDFSSVETIFCYVNGDQHVSLRCYADAADILQEQLNDDCLTVVGVGSMASTTGNSLAIDLYVGRAV